MIYIFIFILVDIFFIQRIRRFIYFLYIFDGSQIGRIGIPVLDIDTAIADQTRAVELFNGTEFLAEAKQALAFYKSVKAMKANP